MAPSVLDFVKGLDLTGEVSVNASEINQMVDLAVPYADKGLVITTEDAAGPTPDVPDAATTTKWQRYLWLRKRTPEALPPVLYKWDPTVASDPTYLNWIDVTVTQLYYVDSIVGLKALNVTPLSDGTLIFVNSYYGSKYYANRIDHGGGLFVWKTGAVNAEDGGRYFEPDSNGTLGRWERILLDGIINIEMYGAKEAVAGGNADIAGGFAFTNACTAEFQKALDALVSTNWTRRLIIPTGNWVVDDTLYFYGGCNIEGNGPGNSRIFINDGVLAGQDLFVSYNLKGVIDSGYTTFGDWDHMTRFANFYVQFAGDKTTRNKTSSAISCLRVGEGNSFENVVVYGGGYFLRIYGLSAPGAHIENCSAHNQAIAAVLISGITINGTLDKGVGPTYFNGFSCDFRGLFAEEQTVSVVKVDNGHPNLHFTGLKIEGWYGGGVVSYKTPSVPGGHEGSISIYDSSFNLGTIGSPYSSNVTGHTVPLAVVKLDSYAAFSPGVVLSNLTLRNGESGSVKETYLIQDVKSGRNVKAKWAFQDYKLEAFPPIYYAGYASTRNHLYVNDKVSRRFNPTSIGWYRVAEQIGLILAGKIAISSKTTVTEIEFSCVPYTLAGSAWIKVNRSTRTFGILTTNTPNITRARVVLLTNGASYLDIYVNKAVDT